MKFKELYVKFKNNLPKSKSGFLIIMGIIGLLLILVSTFTDGKENVSKSEPELVQNDYKSKTEAYTEALESRLEEILSDMLSDTKVSVMITLESGIEYVYADEIKTDAEIKNDKIAYRVEQSDTNENNYVIFKDSEGNEQALLVTEKMPEIRGVVIVCESGHTEAVSVAVRTAVCKVLSLDENKICVIGRH